MNQSNKILIADDSESYLRIMQQIFEIVGQKHELFFARNGKEACELALQNSPDLIIVDVIMPEMNGMEVAKFLRNNKETADIPIIMLSATESLKAAYEVGANDFISKPFNQYELLIKVRSALNLVEKIKQAQVVKRLEEDKVAEFETLRETNLVWQDELSRNLKFSGKIQKSILPLPEKIDSVLNKNFILSIPGKIVSGDFYWIGNYKNYKTVAAVDCTGQGIPGALMTMAGMAFLNDILGQTSNFTPALVLNQLRDKLMNLLKQTVEDSDSCYGMDVSLVMVDPEKKKLHFAGAYNPIYVVQNNQLVELKGDRMPIGINLDFERDFQDNSLDVNPGDCVYLFTDGFADQFGGAENKKFRYKQFQELILDVHNLPMSQQKDILQKTFTEWKGSYSQVDDVLVIGFKI
jgi:sigma-B regulation protein RsbU (phosphoserine phosphatase)